MKLHFIAAGAIASAFVAPASAHLSYSGRNFGEFSGLLSQSVTISNQAITGNFGWADAADTSLSLDLSSSGVGVDNLALGDSHKARAFRFHLDNTATITLTASANATATATSVGGLLPGFSVYSGLAALAPFAATQTALPSSADHDFNDASVAWRTSWAQSNLGAAFDATATQGGWNALGNWKLGGDGDLPGDFSQLSSFTYVGHASDTDLNGVASGSFVLGPGDYTIMVGGIDIANKGTTAGSKAYGLSLNLSVAAVPEPGTYAMLLAGLGLLGAMARRRLQ